MSRQSSAHSIRRPSSHCSESDDDLEETPDTPISGHSRISGGQQVSSNQGTSGDPLVSDSAPTFGYPPMPHDSRMSSNPQMHNNQQLPDDSPMPDFGLRHGYPPTDSYPPTHSYYPARGYPPIHPLTFHLPLIPSYPLPYGHPYMEPNHHPSPKSQAYGSASSPRASTPGMAGRRPRPNAELSSPPIPQSPPLKYQAIDARHSPPAQTPTNNPAQPDFSPAGNTHREESKDIQSPRTEMAATEDQKKEIIIAVMGVTGNTHEYTKFAVH